MPYFFSEKNDDAQAAAATANEQHSTAVREGLMGLHELSRSSLGSGGYRYNYFFFPLILGSHWISWPK